MTKERLHTITNARLNEINTALAILPDEVATNMTVLFQKWKVDTDYTIGERRQYNGVLWKCIQAHHSQDDWTPDVATSLWAKTSIDEWPEWSQPIGATDAYMSGDKVSYNNQHWVSSIDNNVWQPGFYGWDAVSN